MKMCSLLLCLVLATSIALGQKKPASQGPKPVSDLPPPHHDISSLTPAQALDELSLWADTDELTNRAVIVPQSEPIKSFGKLDPLAPTSPSDDKPYVPSTKNLYVLHIVTWSDKTLTQDDPAKINFVSSSWYAFAFDGRVFKSAPISKGKLAPIYGMTNEILISVCALQKAPKRPTTAPFITYSTTVKEKTAPNVAAFEALLGGVLGVTTGASLENGIEAGADKIALTINVQGFTVSPKALHAPFDVAYTATVSTKNPDTVEKPADPEKPKKDLKAKPDAVAATVSATDCYSLTDTSKCSLSRTISVDSRQYWDVGIDGSFRGPRENKYALSAANVITQTHTIHSAFIATFDLSPWARKLPMGAGPYFQVGVPLSGAAFHLPYFGLAQPMLFTKKWLPLSVYGGVGLMKQTFPKTLKVGAPTTAAAFASDLTSDWARKPVYGIELPVTAVVKKIKSGVGGSGSAGSKAQ